MYNYIDPHSSLGIYGPLGPGANAERAADLVESAENLSRAAADLFKQYGVNVRGCPEMRMFVTGRDPKVKQNGQSSPQQRLGFPLPVGAPEQLRQIAKVGGHVRMIRPKAFFIDR